MKNAVYLNAAFFCIFNLRKTTSIILVSNSWETEYRCRSWQSLRFLSLSLGANFLQNWVSSQELCKKKVPCERMSLPGILDACVMEHRRLEVAKTRCVDGYCFSLRVHTGIAGVFSCWRCSSGILFIGSTQIYSTEIPPSAIQWFHSPWQTGCSGGS